MAKALGWDSENSSSNPLARWLFVKDLLHFIVKWKGTDTKPNYQVKSWPCPWPGPGDLGQVGHSSHALVSWGWWRGLRTVPVHHQRPHVCLLLSSLSSGPGSTSGTGIGIPFPILHSSVWLFTKHLACKCFGFLIYKMEMVVPASWDYMRMKWNKICKIHGIKWLLRECFPINKVNIGRKSKKEGGIHIADSLCCTAETNTTL